MAIPRYDPELKTFLLEARQALSLSQKDVAAHLGVSRRTAGRWETGQSVPTVDDLVWIVKRLHPHDPELAARLLRPTDHTLVTLGLEPPPASPEHPVPAERPSGPTQLRDAAPPLPARVLAESVLCAAAEALGAAPASVRPALRAAFARAREMRLTVEQLEEGLAPPAPPAASD